MNQYDQLPDRELDALVAEKVMGWRIEPEGDQWRVHNPQLGNSWTVQSPDLAAIDDDSDGRLHWRYSLPSYASEISVAMSVIEKMREQGWSFACTLYEGNLPYASFCKRTAASSKNAEAPTLPRAIVLAALAIVGGEGDR